MWLASGLFAFMEGCMRHIPYPRGVAVLRRYGEVIQAMKIEEQSQREKFERWLAEIRQKESALRGRN